MINIKKIFLLVLILSAFGLPFFSYAQEWSGVVPCGKVVDVEGKVVDKCEFKDFMKLLNNVIDFILKKMILPIAAILFAYAGLLLVTSGGGEGKTKAKGIFWNAFIGLIIALAAWLIIHTLLAVLGYTDAGWIGF